MKLSWQVIQKKIEQAEYHAKEAQKTAGMVMDAVLGKKNKGKVKRKKGVIVKGKCTCPE